jgi:hypothetical protein
MDIKNIRFSDKIKQNDDEFIIHEELIEYITNQFDFINIGINYLEYHDTVPNTIYDWLLQQITENYLEIDEIQIVYSDINRLKITTKSLYEFLFVDILDFKDKIDYGHGPEQLRFLTKNKLNYINDIANISNKEKLSYDLIKWSIINDSLNNSLDLLNQNYWPLVIEKIQI